MTTRRFTNTPAAVGALLLASGLVAACQGPPTPTPAAAAAPAPADPETAARDKLVARGKSLELPTKYEPVPGDALSHHTSGFAKTMCSAVFMTGYDIEFAAEHVGYFTAPYAERAKVGKPVVDRAKKSVSIALPNGVTRTAVYTGSQGCVTLPEGSDKLSFTPKTVSANLPSAGAQDWPMGDRLPKTPFPAELDEAKIKSAVDAAFEIPDAETTAFVVTWKGRLIGERYGEGITITTPLESWSMGKSVTSTIMGTLIHKGVYTLDQPAPIPEWQAQPGDPRAQIKIQDILRMSSGIRIISPSDPDYDPKGPYPDHLYLYTGGVDSFKYAATRPQQWPPNTVGRYRNTDPVLTNYLNKLGAEKLKVDYLSYPQRNLWDKIGVRTMVMETDPFGNFLTQGYEYMSGRDWARLGNLYLNDGVTPGGERILPENYNDFVSTLAPAWVADERPVYGGFFWINGDGAWPIPKEAYSMNGAGGQQVWIIPSHDLVVVRIGNFKGQRHVRPTLGRALEILMASVPKAAAKPTTGN
jgi:CubicO group peptidase (beta-lactamase class C family)